ncbi:hypothetical protein LJR030_000535 [Rhizobium sp. LjRoot30]|uniref:hypothetical protein n=1 Tax=Rhizobium sp. LjRoot30 TaxID=3342320 RepID=UPI003ED1387C
MSDLKNMAACFLGGFFGSFLFLIFAVYFFGDPFHDWFSSAYGIFSADKQQQLTTLDRVKIYDLLTRGLIVPSDGIISNLTDLYGNMIQALIGVLALATVLAAFAVRWQSIQSAQEFVDQKADAHFASEEFKGRIRTAVQDYVDTLDPNTNPQVASASGSWVVLQEIANLRDRLSTIERNLRRSASPEEAEDDFLEEEEL